MLPRDRYLNVVNMVSRRLQREWNRVQRLPNRDLEVTTERTRLRLNVVDWNRFPPNVANPFLIVVATLLQHSAYVSKNEPISCLDETRPKMAAVFEPKLV